MRTRLCIVRMGNQGEGIANKSRKLILNKGFESTTYFNLRHDSITRLFEPKTSLSAQRLRLQNRTGPVAFFHPPAFDNKDLFYAEGCGRFNCFFQTFRAGE